MVRIRLKRTGRANRPCYRIVVQDIRSRRDSPALDILGTYEPLKESDAVSLDAERARQWIAKGAKPSEKVAILFKKAGVALA